MPQWSLLVQDREYWNRVIATRHHIRRVASHALDQLGFIYVDTPILGPMFEEYNSELITVTTSGVEYALQHSPQVFKQAAIANGLRAYYQFARCFRLDDPDPRRHDRAIEFSQLDIEMRAISIDEIIATAEVILMAIAVECGLQWRVPFPRMTYAEAMSDYGTDRPAIPSAPGQPMWITSFPFAILDEAGRMRPSHHIFAEPTDPCDLASSSTHSFDLVIDGTEVGGGDLRINSAALQREVAQFFGVDLNVIDEFVKLLDSGVDRHGGMAIGLDRMLMHVIGTQDIRNVIPFPMPARRSPS